MQCLDFSHALELLLSVEREEKKHSEHIKEELPAIISHWLQSPDEPPILLDRSYGEKWRGIIDAHCLASGGLQNKQRHISKSKKNEILIDYSQIPFPPTIKPEFRFIDLFAGIGGFRIALQSIGGKCVFSSEWDKHAKQTYLDNYGEVPFGDIRKFTADNLIDSDIKEFIPDHNILAGGFPCQPFSRAGVSARTSLGQKHGFLCDIQGTLFFDLVRIASVKRPDILFLENVKNLRTHDKGKTFEKIQSIIKNDLGYSFNSVVLDSSFLVPQKRKRCYMVCFRDKSAFDFPSDNGEPIPLSSILENKPNAKYTISDRMWAGHIRRTKKNIERGTGFVAYEADKNKPANTLVARYYKDGKECLVPQKGKNPRMLTPRECARLQGYPENFKIHRQDNQAYRQFGNSVAVPMIKIIVENFLKHIKQHGSH